MIPKPPQRVAVGGTRRCRCSEPHRAGGGGEQWTACQSERESPTLPPGRAGQECEGDTRDTASRDLEEGPTS